MKTSPIPPFPSNVNTAPLLSISLSKLLAHDVVEEDRLWDAACSLGFFYLDVIPNSNSSQGSDSSSQGQGILHEVDELFDIGKSIFEVDEETKKAFDYKERGSYFGYVLTLMSCYLLFLSKVITCFATVHVYDDTVGSAGIDY